MRSTPFLPPEMLFAISLGRFGLSPIQFMASFSLTYQGDKRRLTLYFSPSGAGSASAVQYKAQWAAYLRKMVRLERL